MDKIKQFLVDNKGCPLTPQATKQLLVKFIELMSEESVVKVEVNDIKALSADVLDSLEVGDVVQKITGNMKHCYIVTYKGDGAGQGICLTYCAAGYMETVSYDRSGSSWVYNSTDVVKGLKEISEHIGFSEGGDLILYGLDGSYLLIADDGVYICYGDYESHISPLWGIDKVNSFSATAGKVLTADGSGGSSWESPSGGTQLYRHRVKIYTDVSRFYYFDIINTSSNEINTWGKLKDVLGNFDGHFIGAYKPTDEQCMIPVTMDFLSSDFMIVYLDASVAGYIDTIVATDYENLTPPTDTVTAL